MGCDIHLYVEKKDNGKWVAIGKPNPDFGKFSFETKPIRYNWLYNTRSYFTFAILAGVRNYGEGFNPISLPKGLPNDLSPEILQEAESWKYDAHNHSWFTLQELLDFDWEQKIEISGFVTLEEYKKCKHTGEPPGFWFERQYNSDLMKLTWEVTYEWAARDFLDTVIPELQKLGNPNDVRIVFWFDN